MKLIWSVFWTIVFVVLLTVRIVAYINFDRHCEGYLKRAADANTVELAAQELQAAIKYAEENGLTSGFTSIVYRSPADDVGFWYKNLVASREELRALSPEASQLEKTNVLMKLRETIMDDAVVTAPEGISVYPYNRMLAFWLLLSFVFAFCGWFVFSLDR